MVRALAPVVASLAIVLVFAAPTSAAGPSAVVSGSSTVPSATSTRPPQAGCSDTATCSGSSSDTSSDGVVDSGEDASFATIIAFMLAVAGTVWGIVAFTRRRRSGGDSEIVEPTGSTASRRRGVKQSS